MGLTPTANFADECAERPPNAVPLGIFSEHHPCKLPLIFFIFSPAFPNPRIRVGNFCPTFVPKGERLPPRRAAAEEGEADHLEDERFAAFVRAGDGPEPLLELDGPFEGPAGAREGDGIGE